MFTKRVGHSTSEVQTQQSNVSEFNFIVIIKNLAQIINILKMNLAK
jgi:hypothetical protein